MYRRPTTFTRTDTLVPYVTLFRSRMRGERGSASLELVILAPALLLILSVIIFAGRVAIAGQSVQQAAEEAARTASLARSQGDADATRSEEHTHELQSLMRNSSAAFCLKQKSKSQPD